MISGLRTAVWRIDSGAGGICSVHCTLQHKVPRGCRLLEDVGFQSTPKLSFGDGGRAQLSSNSVKLLYVGSG